MKKPILPRAAGANLLIYLLCLLIAAVGMLYGKALAQEFASLRVWEPQNILFLLAGIPFLLLQTRASLPNFLEAGVSNRQRFLQPAAIGAFFGILDVFVIKIWMHPQPYESLPPFLQPFPYSLFLYFSGAFEIEVFYRLIPITLLLLLGKWLAGGKYFNVFLGAAMVLTSLREPLEQLPEGEFPFVAYAFLTGFLMNYLQALYFKNAGFVSSLTLRLGHYAFWHILLGVYVQYVEL